jgi:hypothetical protein
MSEGNTAASEAARLGIGRGLRNNRGEADRPVTIKLETLEGLESRVIIHAGPELQNQMDLLSVEALVEENIGGETPIASNAKNRGIRERPRRRW